MHPPGGKATVHCQREGGKCQAEPYHGTLDHLRVSSYPAVYTAMTRTRGPDEDPVLPIYADFLRSAERVVGR